MRRNLENVSTKQERIARLAEQSPEMGFTSLAYMIDLEWLEEAYRRTRKDGAVGIDGQTAQEYEQSLEDNLQSLLDRAKSGRYKAPPVRRVHIPKGGSRTETRPIGIPTLEDKILQRAAVMLLEPIYEHDFEDCSYGFRPGRSAHKALESLWKQGMGMKGGWILEVDIRKFFDTLDHAHLRTLLKHRVRDGVLLRLIGKWLNAGVMENGSISYPNSGSPQGGVISPLLANIYLHYVLDVWFKREVQPRMSGRSYLIRYADDFVMGFSNESDARRVMEVLPKRFTKYGLTIHPAKTRLIPFQRPDDQDGPKGPGKFELLGFTHYWGRSRRGNWVIKRKTSSNRLTRSLRSILGWCKRNFHQPVREQQQTMRQKMQGHYGYYGITGNAKSLSGFQVQVHRIWRYWLARRNRERELTWEKFNLLLERYPLPLAVVVHSMYRRPAKP
jgi:group II intron reverse transcriptase/maturase